MYKYEMDPTRTVGATERTRDAGRTGGQTDGQTDGIKPIYPPNNFVVRGYNDTRASEGLGQSGNTFIFEIP